MDVVSARMAALAGSRAYLYVGGKEMGCSANPCRARVMSLVGIRLDRLGEDFMGIRLRSVGMRAVVEVAGEEGVASGSVDSGLSARWATFVFVMGGVRTVRFVRGVYKLLLFLRPTSTLCWF